MRFYALAYLLGIAVGRQVPIVPNVNAGPPSTGNAASMQVPIATDVNVGPPSTETAASMPEVPTEVKSFFESIGKMIPKSAEGAHEKKQNREDLAMGRLNVLKVNLPQLREIAATLCNGANGAHLCEIRMKMFKSISERIEQGDTEVVELLRKSVQLLKDFHEITDNLRGAISSLTVHELKDRPPEGMKMIADINPMDDSIDRYEWSEYMKAIYLFTVNDDTAHALELKEKSGNRMKVFVSWDLRDEEVPKPVTESVAPEKPV